MSASYRYSDLDLKFLSHPVTGDISILSDDNSIKQAIRTLVLTQLESVPFRSDFGTPVDGLLFESVGPLTAISIQSVIQFAITNFEPRVRVINVDVIYNYDDRHMEITIQYSILNTEKVDSLTIMLEKVR